jgi:hypothetical protein
MRWPILFLAMLMCTSASIADEPDRHFLTKGDSLMAQPTVKVLFDSKSHQAIRHQGTEPQLYEGAPPYEEWRGRRLSGLHDALATRGYAVAIDGLNDTTLKDVDVLVISGRREVVPFSEIELAAIVAFHNRGGGLLLMGNHKHFVAPQNQVARALDLPVTLNDDWVREAEQRLVLTPGHPISRDCAQGLRIRTSCTLNVREDASATVLVRNEDPEIDVFAVAIERAAAAQGRVVVMTSGGHIASLDDSLTDLFGSAANATWTLNVIQWLAR